MQKVGGGGVGDLEKSDTNDKIEEDVEPKKITSLYCSIILQYKDFKNSSSAELIFYSNFINHNFLLM